MARSLEQRFWRKVTKTDGCWLWIGSVDPSGYARLCQQDKRYLYAHRYSYRLHHGRFDLNQVVRHHCSHRHCVHPDHLYLARHGQSKLTEEQVCYIRANPRERLVDLARQFGVTPSTIGKARCGHNWFHI